MTTRATAQWEDHWRTWSINRDYYGVSDPSVDRDRTRWSIEWVTPNTEVAARALVQRTAEIDAVVIAHQPADARGNRRCRLAMLPLADGRIEIREYDFNRWTATI